MKIIVLLLLTIFLQAETKLGETRLGFEFTPISSVGYTAPYNFKFKQKALIDDNQVEIKVFRRHYSWDERGDNEEYDRLKVWPRIKTKYYVFYEGMYDFYSGDIDKKTYRSLLGFWHKFDRRFEAKVAYTWKDKINSDNEHDRSNWYSLIMTGNIFKVGKHKLGYEQYNFFNTETQDSEHSLEIQYKYSITDDIDIYAYSVNGYDIKENKDNQKLSRLDLGIYWYF